MDEYVPDPPQKDKICRRCGLYKPLTEFWKRGQTSKYYAGYCKACHTAPFKNTNIVCPHCNGKILCVGVDAKDNPVGRKHSVIAKMKQEIEQGKKERKELKDNEDVEIKDIFK